MMHSRIILALIVVGTLVATTTSLEFAQAREGYWQGDVSTEWPPSTSVSPSPF